LHNDTRIALAGPLFERRDTSLQRDVCFCDHSHVIVHALIARIVRISRAVGGRTTH